MASKTTFSEQLRRAIQQSELSMYAIAKQTGVDKGQLSRFMSGERGLNVESFETLANLLGLELVERQAAKPAKGKRGAK
jgi:transcriptional regulator with XRE-family HTH domain